MKYIYLILLTPFVFLSPIVVLTILDNHLSDHIMGIIILSGIIVMSLILLKLGFIQAMKGLFLEEDSKK